MAQTRLLLLASALVHDCFSSYVINFGRRRNYLVFFCGQALDCRHQAGPQWSPEAIPDCQTDSVRALNGYGKAVEWWLNFEHLILVGRVPMRSNFGPLFIFILFYVLLHYAILV